MQRSQAAITRLVGLFARRRRQWAITQRREMEIRHPTNGDRLPQTLA
jgi:hypothetical protein